MTLSIKGGGGMINEPPIVSGLKAIEVETTFIKIQYTIHDLEMTYCRQYLILNGEKTEITGKSEEISNDTFVYTIKSLKDGTNYNIQLEASDGHDTAKSDNLNVTTLKNYNWGIRVDESNSNPESCCTYIEDSIGMSPATFTSLGKWKDKWPFNKIRLVGFKAGKVVKEINPNNKKQYLDGSTVQTDVDVMVEIPKIYYKITQISNGYEIRISNIKMDLEYKCLAHTVNGVEKDFIYVGTYLGYKEENRLRSRSGVTIFKNKSLSELRTLAHNNGEGYQIINLNTLTLLRILYLILYKNLNSQTALGFSDRSDNITGATDTQGMICGNGANYGGNLCFLGLEDFWGLVFQIVDGIILNSKNVMINTDNKNFNDTGSGYTNVGAILNTSGFIKSVKCTDRTLFLPQNTTGSENTYYCDTFSLDSGGKVFTFGGAYMHGKGNGIFRIETSNLEYDLYTSRLCYLG